MFKNIPENVKTIINSSAPLAIILVLFLFVGKFGISKIIDIRDQINQATSEQNRLIQKVDLLQTIGTLDKTPDLATNALPSGNSALLTISQLKNLALSDIVALSNIKSGNEVKDTSGLSRVDISFEITGSRDQVVAFVKDISSFAPITVVDSVKLNESVGSTHGTIAVKSFWASLPATLPGIAESLDELTPEEMKILTSVTSLTQPVFLTLPPASAGGKTDPFTP